MMPFSILVRGPNFQSTPRSRPGWVLCAYVLAAVLFAVAVAQPFPSFLLDTVRVVGPDMGSADLCCAAGDDDILLAAWADADLGGPRVKAARARPGLVLLDSVCLNLSGADLWYLGEPVAVAYSGRNFLVTWYGRAADLAGIVGALCDTAGYVVDRLVIDTAGTNVYSPAVAFDGTNYVVAWSGDLRAKFIRVSPAGVVLDSLPRLICPALPHGQGRLALASSADACFAVFERIDRERCIGLQGNVVMPDGSVLDPAGFVVSGHENVRTPAATFDGHHFVTAWSEVRPDLEEELRVCRVTRDGAALDSGGILVAHAEAIHNYDLGARGETTLVSWVESHFESRRVLARRLNSEGGILDSTALVLAPSGSAQPALEPLSPAIVAYEGHFAVVWSHWFGPDSGDQSRDVVARRVTREGAVLDSTAAVLSMSTGRQVVGDVAACADTFLAVWQDFRPEAGHPLPGIYGARFTACGASLGAAFRIGGPRSSEAATAANGRSWLVCWRDDVQRAILGVRVSAAGAVLDSPPIWVGPNPSLSARGVDVCAQESLFVVVWSCGYPGVAYSYVYLARVAPDGTVMDTTRITKDDGPFGYPHIAKGDSTSLVCWRGFRGDIWVGVLDSTGRMRDTAKVIGRGVSGTRNPKVCYGAGVFLLVDDLRGMAWRVSAQGTLLDSVRLPPWQGTAVAGVVFDGDNFVATEVPFGFNGVKALRVTPEGSVLDSVLITLVELNRAQSLVPLNICAAASGSRGGIGLVFSSYEFPDYMAVRARAAAFRLPPGAIAERGGAEKRALCGAGPTIVAAGRVFRVAGTGSRPEAVGLYDAAGRRLAVLPAKGRDGVVWGIDFETRRLRAGVYFLVLQPSWQTLRFQLAR